MPTVIKGQPASKEVLQMLTGLYKPVALGFSCGRDSIATWIAMLEYGIDTVPVYFRLVPSLRFVNEELDYFEQKFGQRIYRYLTLPSSASSLRRLTSRPIACA